MRRFATVIFVLVPVLLTGACGLWGRHKGPEPEPVVLSVENQNFNDATIYAIIRDTRFRLGTVNGHSTDRFNVPNRPNDVQFEIHLLASQTHLTEPITVFPGDELVLVITADVRSTRLIRRS